MSKRTEPLHSVMLVDAWFPTNGEAVGEFSGMQVHVHALRQHLENVDTKVELFYPSNPNLFIRWSWPLLVIYQVLSYARSHSVDIIHTHGTLSTIPGKILSVILKTPIIHTVHRASDLILEHKTLRAFFQWLVFTRIRYHAEISIANSFLDQPNRNTNIRVIPNGIDIQAFDAVENTPHPHPLLIWVGRDHPTKGLEYLKKAIVRVRKVIPNLETELVTGGRLAGRELIKAYKRAHLFVLPSLHETQPISLLEAWAAKLPVIVTAVGDNARMVQDGVNGLVVESANVSQLTDAILKILRARTFDKQLAQAGYEYVKKHFSWHEVAVRTKQVYLDALETVHQEAGSPAAQKATSAA